MNCPLGFIPLENWIVSCVEVIWLVDIIWNFNDKDSTLDILKSWDLDDGLKIVQVDELPEETFQSLVHDNLLATHPMIPWREDLSDAMQQKHRKLKSGVESRFFLRLLVMDGEAIVGLALGGQQSESTEFYMGVSLVVEAYRRRGLYGKLLDIVLSLTSSMGFSAVKSRHINTNNPILIAKLKKGFIINGFELDETMGPLLRMVYYHDDTRRRAANFRSGDIREWSLIQANKK